MFPFKPEVGRKNPCQDSKELYDMAHIFINVFIYIFITVFINIFKNVHDQSFSLLEFDTRL